MNKLTLEEVLNDIKDEVSAETKVSRKKVDKVITTYEVLMAFRVSCAIIINPN